MAGVGSRAMKRIRNRGNRMLVNSPMISLPPELVTEVLARVASSSATDLFTAKLRHVQIEIFQFKDLAIFFLSFL